MQGAASCIDGSYAGRGENNVFFLCSRRYITQESRLPRTCLTSQEQGMMCKLNDLQSLLQLWIL